MKYNFDEPTMQVAIDAACEKLGKGDFRPTEGLLETTPRCSDWSRETALELLPETPPLIVDGKTPGQICWETWAVIPPVIEHGWNLIQNKEAWEHAASAVLAAFGNKSQFDFTTEELVALDSLCNTQELTQTQVMRQALRCYQMSVQGMQPMRGPELTLEPVEQPAEIPWTPWNGGECPLKDEEVEEWEYTLRYGGINKKLVFPSTYRWTHTGGNGDIIAYRVTKWREGFDPVGWKAKCGESLTALQISKSCHEKAETALGNLLAIIHRDGGHYQSEHGAEKAVEEAHQVWSRLISRTEKAEAELALMTLDYDKCRRERGELLNQRDQLLTHPQLSTFRPIAEAGEVPAGCVRVYGQFLEREKRWIATTSQFNDAHFADIHIPESETPEVIHDGGEVFEKVEPVKPTPSTFTAHGKEWTRHVPGDPMPCDGDARVEWLLGSEIEGGYLDLKMKASELVWEYPHAWRYADELGKATSEIIIPPKWTPTVGDVVTLKSGGPKMTVNSIKDGVLCNYFDADGKLNASYFPAATLTKADS